LQLKDLEAIDNKIEKYVRMAKTGDREAVTCLGVLKVYKKHLEEGKSARSVEVEDDHRVFVEDLFLLTEKPVLYVCNVDESSVVNGNEYVERVKETVKDEDAAVLTITAAIESDIAQLDSPEDRHEFLQDIGLSEPGVNKLINGAYELLNLSTYFTAGVKEVRAWTIGKGYTAPEAAGVIHTDFQKGFIKAEVIKYDDFVQLGSEQACKEAGKMAMEGKAYVVEDGDIMHFKFNV